MDRTKAAALIGLVLLAVSACDSAPPLEVAPDVDLSQFTGQWYEIARLPRSTQADCYGTTAFYTQSSDGSFAFDSECNLGSSTGPLYSVAMTATVPNVAVPAKLSLQVGVFTGDYWILEVGSHYEYAVVGHPSRLYWWLLSRTPTLDETTIQGVTSRATAEAFDMSQIEYTPQPPGTSRGAPIAATVPSLNAGCSIATVRATDDGRLGWGVLGAALALVWVRARRRATAPRSHCAGRS
jgi:apolipoprotein D and lipocalin family protein